MDNGGRKEGWDIAEEGQLDDSQIVGTMHMSQDEGLLDEQSQQMVQVAGDVVCYFGALVLYEECFRARSEVKGMFSLHIQEIRLE